MSSSRRSLVVPLSAATILCLTACSGASDIGGGDSSSDSGVARTNEVPDNWYQVTKDELAGAPDPTSEIPTIDLDAPCELVDTIDIAGEPAEPFGAGASALDGTGSRYVCQFSEPSSDLVVVQAGDDSSFAALRENAKAFAETGNEQTDTTITVGERDILVKKTVYPTNDSHVDYAATYSDDDNLGLVLLDVETSDTRGLIDSYDEQQAAEDLAAILDTA